MPRLIEQDPNEKLDYAIDYSDRLPVGDNIASSSWSVPVALTSSSPSFSGQTASVFITGGVSGTDYTITNQATSVGGRIVEDFIILQVRNSS